LQAAETDRLLGRAGASRSRTVALRTPRRLCAAGVARALERDAQHAITGGLLERHARHCATGLWRRHGRQLPVDVEAIAGAASVKVLVSTFDEQRPWPGCVIVFADDSPAIQRGVIARAIGTVVLNGRAPDWCLGCAAAMFADELLVPRAALLRLAPRSARVGELAERFAATRLTTVRALHAARAWDRVSGW
jgi:hypothetical protein